MLQRVNHVRRIANELDVDASVIMSTSHGRRCIDVLKIIAPEKASWECKLSSQSRFIPSRRQLTETAISQSPAQS